MSSENKDQQPGEDRGTGGNAEKFGSKSQMGATSTDFDKIGMQRVDANDADELNQSDRPYGEDLGTNDKRRGAQRDNRSGTSKDDDIIDSGGIRTAAFDEGNEPRDPESLKSRGTTLGSDDLPERTR